MTHSEPKPEPSPCGESASLIAAVAEHEQALLERLAQAEQDAKGILDRARAQAEALGTEESERLAKDVREIRHAAAAAHARAESEVRSATAQELALIRERTKARSGEVVEAIVRMVLPASREEAAS
jgi:Vacuolar (H+)-ATPase G subunit